MLVLVVGGTGFIGRNLVPMLGPAVRVLVHRNQPGWLPAGCETVKGDVLDAASLHRAADGVRVVLNLTGQEGGDSSQVRQINRVGSALLADVAAKAGVKHFIHFSTAQVYGEREMAEETAPVSPASPYATEKLAAEQAVERFAGAGALCILRLTNVYGPFQHKGFFGHLVGAMRGGPPVVVNGDGTQRRDFVYVGDVASVVERLVADQGNSGVFNIGSGQTRSLVEVMGEVGKLIGRPVPCEWRPGADAGGSVNGVSIAKARTMLGFQPIDLRTGLQRTLTRSITGGER